LRHEAIRVCRHVLGLEQPVSRGVEVHA
jgi:hypothetical protein